MKAKYPILLILPLLVILTSCSNAPVPPTPTATPAPLVLTDGLERQVSFAQPAQRIVSLAPSNTEILFAIGAGGQVVGRDQFSDYPSQAKSIADVGGDAGAFNTEAILALKPDLVLASQLSPAEQVKALEDLGLKVYLLPNPTTLQEMFNTLSLVGQITGRQKEAQALVEQLTARVKAIDEKLVGIAERPLVFYELDATDVNAPYTAGPGTFIDLLITRAGGTNLGSKLPDAYPQVSIEKLLVDNPQVIILGDSTWGGVTPEVVMQRESWSGLQAVQQGQVYSFDENLVVRPGPRLVDGLEALAKLLHPELFE